MSDSPESAAREALGTFGKTSPSLVMWVTKAIREAEERGAAREREACAGIVNDWDLLPAKEWDEKYGPDATIVEAIRARAKEVEGR